MNRTFAICLITLLLALVFTGCGTQNDVTAADGDIFEIQATQTPQQLPTPALVSPTPEPTPVLTPAPSATPEANFPTTPAPKPTAKPTEAPTQRPEASPAASKSPDAVDTSSSDQSADDGGYSSSVASSIIVMTNRQRSANGLSELEESSTLTKAAKTRAKEISTLFSHTRPDGTSALDISSKAYAENIGQGMNVSEAVIMEGWMNSAGHRANILNADYGTIGVACYSTGGYDYYVQLFGH